MEQALYDTATGAGMPDFSASDRRSGKSRLSLLIRTAKIVTDLGEFLCIVRDMSDGGVRLRFFHPLPDAGTIRLVLANGDAIPIEKAWESGGHAGFRFAGKVDVQAFIAEAGRFPKRPLRIEAEFPGTVTVDGLPSRATVLNISRQGARIECAHALSLGPQVRRAAQVLRHHVQGILPGEGRAPQQ